MACKFCQCHFRSTFTEHFLPIFINGKEDCASYNGAETCNDRPWAERSAFPENPSLQCPLKHRHSVRYYCTCICLISHTTDIHSLYSFIYLRLYQQLTKKRKFHEAG